jgi:NAD(P)-dependent dehydrogenase (short-subunit alcohol dehydrogenase family)
MAKETHVQVGEESSTRYRRFAGHWRSNCKASGRRWSKRSHYLCEGRAASAVVKAIELGGGKAIAIQADAANVEEVKNAVEKTVTTFGGLDVLVNNAGTAIPKTFEETTLEEMDRVIDIACFGWTDHHPGHRD